MRTKSSNRIHRQQGRRFALPLALCVPLLAGCKTFSADGGLAGVSEIVGPEIKTEISALRTQADAQAARALLDQLLSRTLNAEAAVRVALLNNRELQAAYNDLGLAEARTIAASLPPSPGFSVERLAGPVEIEIEKRIVANILALATLPMRTEIAEERFRGAQLIAAQQTLRTAAAARRSYYRAVAGRQLVDYLEQAAAAADTASQLAQRLGETGALNKLDQAREHVFHAEIAAQLARARQSASLERERLVRAMGLWGRDLAFRLPRTLPAMPRRPLSMPGIEIEALRRRIDIQLARGELGLLAKSYGLTQATRFINVLELSGITRTTKERETGARPRDDGFEVEFQIPLFDFGETRVREAQETYLRAVNRLAARAVDARSQAREAYRSYRSAFDIVTHYQREVLPLRKIISEETLLRYNAMQIDVFALLAEARGRIATTVAAIEAQREFWIASVNLSAAVVGGDVADTSSEVAQSGAPAPEGAAAH